MVNFINYLPWLGRDSVQQTTKKISLLNVHSFYTEVRLIFKLICNYAQYHTHLQEQMHNSSLPPPIPQHIPGAPILLPVPAMGLGAACSTQLPMLSNHREPPSACGVTGRP